jgi:hypothetical protein
MAPHPFEMVVEKRAGLIEVALHRQSDDHRSARAAHPQRHAPRGRVTAHFDGSLQAPDAKLFGRARQNRPGPPHG